MRALSVRIVVVAAATGGLATGAATLASADGGSRAGHFAASLSGYEEVPSVSTRASGSFRAALARDGRSISWRLTYRRLETRALQAHIHFAERHVNGGVSVFLCSNLGSSANPAQACPRRDGTLRGTIRARDVIGPSGQGIEPGRFRELVRAMRAGATYANVHSTRWPTGEIRGQIVPLRR